MHHGAARRKRGGATEHSKSTSKASCVRGSTRQKVLVAHVKYRCKQQVLDSEHSLPAEPQIGRCAASAAATQQQVQPSSKCRCTSRIKSLLPEQAQETVCSVSKLLFSSLSLATGPQSYLYAEQKLPEWLPFAM